MAENTKPQLTIDLPEELAEGTYANLAVITHSPTEFVLDFIRMMPGMPKARVQSRMILTPQHAKRLMRALNDNLNKYESQHGPIKDVASPEVKMPMHFGGPKGEA